MNQPQSFYSFLETIYQTDLYGRNGTKKGPSLPGAEMKILEKIIKRKCETTVIHHVVFRQKKISKRNSNLHAPF